MRNINLRQKLFFEALNCIFDPINELSIRIIKNSISIINFSITRNDLSIMRIKNSFPINNFSIMRIAISIRIINFSIIRNDFSVRINENPLPIIELSVNKIKIRAGIILFGRFGFGATGRTPILGHKKRKAPTLPPSVPGIALSFRVKLNTADTLESPDYRPCFVPTAAKYWGLAGCRTGYFRCTGWRDFFKS